MADKRYESLPARVSDVTECVASEGLRLLVGGALRDPWHCPHLENGGGARRWEERAYADGTAFLHRAHTMHSVYECSLASGCDVDCRNRLVQRGLQYRLE